jgi:hypothetical protein
MGYFIQLATCSYFWVCRLSFTGVRLAYVHRFGLGDWWEHPICWYSITGWPIGVMSSTAVSWTG